MSGKKNIAAIPATVIPGGSRGIVAEDRVLLEHTPSGRRPKVRRSPATPSLDSSTSFPKPKRARRGLAFQKDDRIHILDSGSEDEDSGDSEDGDSELFDYNTLRMTSREIRDNIIEACENESEEEQSVEAGDVVKSMEEQNVKVEDVVESVEEQSVEAGDVVESMEEQNVKVEDVVESVEEQSVEVGDVVESMEGQNAKVEDVVESVEEQSVEVGYVVESMEGQNAKVEDVVESVEEQSVEVGDVVESMEGQNAKVEDLVESVEEQSVEVGDVVESMEGQNAKVVDVVESVEEQSVDAGDVVESMEGQNAKVEDVVESVEEQSVEVGDVVESMEGQNAKVEDVVESVEEQSVEVGDVVESMEGQNAKVEDVVESVEEQSVEVGDVVESMEGQNAKVEDVVESVEEQSVEVGDVVESMEGQNAKVEDVVESVEEQSVEVGDVVESMEGQNAKVEDVVESVEEQSVEVGDVVESMEGQNAKVEDVVESVEGQGLEQPAASQEYANLTDFSWTDDYSTFTPQEEIYLRIPGSSFASQDPAEIFVTIWDESIMSEIVRETNKYAWETIAALSEVEGGIPGWLSPWHDTTIEEMYRYFAVLILMSICVNARVKDYWTTGVMGMPEFRMIMSRNRFDMLSRFMHFVDNSEITHNLSAYQKKIAKIRPILDHCNRKFSELYTPMKHLSLDESLLLWKGKLSWVQIIRTKAARFGLKTYELCEAETGYLLKCLLYAGKGSTMIEEPTHGFENTTAKVVLELMDGYLDLGHCIIMDNWYNQLSLTRFLKRRRTDVIGTMNPRRMLVPREIKYAASNPELRMGDHIARHCGDISLVGWKDVKHVTAVSTFHTNTMVPVHRGGENILKPAVILDYNKYMGGVDSKDQQLSMYLMERKRGKKWYIKLFKRLINTSVLNSFIIYRKNPSTKLLSHRDFRRQVAMRLLEKFAAARVPPKPPVDAIIPYNKNAKRLSRGNHFPMHTEKVNNKLKQKRCARCSAAGRRTLVTMMCTFCEVPLCVGCCWVEYHTFKNLR